jgi:hypothetical protein
MYLNISANSITAEIYLLPNISTFDPSEIGLDPD